MSTIVQLSSNIKSSWKRVRPLQNSSNCSSVWQLDWKWPLCKLSITSIPKVLVKCLFSLFLLVSVFYHCFSANWGAAVEQHTFAALLVKASPWRQRCCSSDYTVDCVPLSDKTFRICHVVLGTQSAHSCNHPLCLLLKTDQIHERLVFFTISEFQYYVNLTAHRLADCHSVLCHEIALNCINHKNKVLKGCF